MDTKVLEWRHLDVSRSSSDVRYIVSRSLRDIIWIIKEL